jgi:hypothetical protein
VPSLSVDDRSYFQVQSESIGGGRQRATWYGVFANAPSTLTDLDVTYIGRASRPCTQTISLFRPSDSQWVPFGSPQTKVNRETTTSFTVATPSAYVQSNGQLWGQIDCAASSKQPCTLSGDFLHLGYTIP